MNWNHFLLLLTGIYLGYYTLIIIADLCLRKESPGQESDPDVLFFSENPEPEIILYEGVPPKAVMPETLPAQQNLVTAKDAYPSPPIESTGALSLKDLSRVAQSGAVHYTKSIPY